MKVTFFIHAGLKVEVQHLEELKCCDGKDIQAFGLYGTCGDTSVTGARAFAAINCPCFASTSEYSEPRVEPERLGASVASSRAAGAASRGWWLPCRAS